MTATELIEIVNKIITDLSNNKKDFEGEAINWADLRCVGVRRYATGKNDWHIEIAEADPDTLCFNLAIEHLLKEEYGISSDVNTEW